MRRLFILLMILAIVPVAARETYNLNRGWQFFSASEQSADNAKYINLPHSWSDKEGCVAANYLKDIYALEEWEQRRVFIKFGGVQRCAQLFVNGKYVGEHRGGATAFTFEITDFLTLQANNTLVVAVNNSPQRDILPTSVEHDVYGGIYRDVEIIVTPQNAISPLYYGSDGVFITTHEATPQLVKGDVRVHVSQIQPQECDVDVEIRDNSEDVIFHQSVRYNPLEDNNELKIPFELSKHIKLWSPQSPSLYSVIVKLRPLDQSQVEDVVSIKSGFRVIESADNSIKINDSPINIKGVALHHDYPAMGGVLTPKEYNADMSLVREMGATAIRSAIQPHGQYLYDLCDKEGIVAWIDLPFHRTPFLSDVAYIPSPRFHENGREQLREIIAQNYNHPSVIMWGLFSTLSTRGDDYLPFLRELQQIATEMDPTRLTVALSDQDGDLNNVTDLIVWRQNIGWERGDLSDIDAWREMLHSKWGYMSSGVSYSEGGDIQLQSKESVAQIRRRGESEWYPEGRQREFHEAYAKSLNDDSKFWGVWLNSMFDYQSSRRTSGMNFSGVVEFSRQTMKDVFYLYKALWNKEQKILYITNRRNNIVMKPQTTIHLYATDDSVAPVLHVGNNQYTMQRVAPSQFEAKEVAIDGRCEVYATQGQGKTMISSEKVEFIYGSPLEKREY